MSIVFYYGSGSPFAWRVWLALEHKRLPYELKVISFSAGDHRTPEFLALNPRHKVPVITDGDFSLYESAVIAEYLEDAYPPSGPNLALWPLDVKQRAIARRLAREADVYVGPPVQRLGRQIFFTTEADQNPDEINNARDELTGELASFEKEFRGDYLAGPLSMADFTLYPFVALALRMELKKRPALAISRALGPKLQGWKSRIEALSYFEKCIPPHWKSS